MDSADWRALAERFEAATEDDIYECVRDLLCFVTLKRGRITYADTIDRAENARIPDLLLGVVVACVPEGWSVTYMQDIVDKYERASTEVSLRGPEEKVRRWANGGCSSRPAALGAAVCRAWAEVAGGKEVAR